MAHGRKLPTHAWTNLIKAITSSSILKNPQGIQESTVITHNTFYTISSNSSSGSLAPDNSKQARCCMDTLD